MTLPKIVGPYSLFQKVGNTLYFSGQIGIDPESGKLEEGITRQTQRACENIKQICIEAGIEMKDICKTTVYITNMSNYERVNGIYESYFKHFPARSCIGVAELPANALVEIEVIAEIV